MTAKIKGAKELEKAIDSLSDPKVRKKAISKGLRAGGNVTLKVARAKAPKDDKPEPQQIFPGYFRSKPLKKALVNKVKTKRGITTAYIGPRIDPPIQAFHHAMLEGGRKSTGGHPGIRPMKYLRRAYETTKTQAVKVILQTMEDWFKKESRG